MARPRMKNSSDVLRILNRMVVAIETDTIDINKARTIIYAASVAGQILKNIEIEGRLDQLEKAAEHATGGHIKAVR